MAASVSVVQGMGGEEGAAGQAGDGNQCSPAGPSILGCCQTEKWQGDGGGGVTAVPVPVGACSSGRWVTWGGGCRWNPLPPSPALSQQHLGAEGERNEGRNTLEPQIVSRLFPHRSEGGVSILQTHLPM